MHEFWCTIDPGIAVQPDNVVAQSESSIVYGLGLALSERITIKGGVVEQSNFFDYKVPRMLDIPRMHVKVIQTDNAPTGAGQMATPLVAPAIAQAVDEFPVVDRELAKCRFGHAGTAAVVGDFLQEFHSVHSPLR